ncbi:MAG: hypothetical protein ACLSWD_11565 [Clostridium sp.]
MVLLPPLSVTDCVLWMLFSEYDACAGNRPLGNFINQEAYGGVVNASFYDHFPAFIRDHMYIDGAFRQPTFCGRRKSDWLRIDYRGL